VATVDRFLGARAADDPLPAAVGIAAERGAGRADVVVRTGNVDPGAIRVGIVVRVGVPLDLAHGRIRGGAATGPARDQLDAFAAHVDLELAGGGASADGAGLGGGRGGGLGGGGVSRVEALVVPVPWALVTAVVDPVLVLVHAHVVGAGGPHVAVAARGQGQTGHQDQAQEIHPVVSGLHGSSPC